MEEAKFRSNNCRKQLQCRKLKTPTVPRCIVLQSKIRLTLSKTKTTRGENRDVEKVTPQPLQASGTMLWSISGLENIIISHISTIHSVAAESPNLSWKDLSSYNPEVPVCFFHQADIHYPDPVGAHSCPELALSKGSYITYYMNKVQRPQAGTAGSFTHKNVCNRTLEYDKQMHPLNS